MNYNTFKQLPLTSDGNDYTEHPPPYTEAPSPYATHGYTPYPQTLVVEHNSTIFHKGARFDGIAKVGIPPPPPGCQPNQYQLMQMNGPIEVVLAPTDQRITAHQGQHSPIPKNKIAPH